MRTFSKVMAIILGLGFLGNLTVGEFWPFALVLVFVFAYFGWRPQQEA